MADRRRVLSAGKRDCRTCIRLSKDEYDIMGEVAQFYNITRGTFVAEAAFREAKRLLKAVRKKKTQERQKQKS